MDLFVFADARGIQQIAVDGDGAFVVEFGAGHRGAVDLGLEHVQLHGVVSGKAMRKAPLYRLAHSRSLFPIPGRQSNARLSISRVRPNRAATSATRPSRSSAAGSARSSARRMTM